MGEYCMRYIHIFHFHLPNQALGTSSHLSMNHLDLLPKSVVPHMRNDLTEKPNQSFAPGSGLEAKI